MSDRNSTVATLTGFSTAEKHLEKIMHYKVYVSPAILEEILADIPHTDEDRVDVTITVDVRKYNKKK